MDTFITALDWVGRVTALISVVALALAFYAWAKGILPAITRLGKGFAKRKIAIFAKGDNLTTLKNLLLGTDLFDKKNIIEISSSDDFDRVERASIFLIYWDDWQDKIGEILQEKKNATALVVYAPKGPSSIPPDKFVELNSKSNVMVTNFRGRLLNDIVVSLMTTSYQ